MKQLIGISVFLLPLAVWFLLPASEEEKTAGRPPNPFVEELEGQLDAHFRSAVEEGAVAGLAVTVVHGDSVLYQATFGQRDAETGEAVNAHTVFRLGSLSKSFGGVLAGILVADSLLSWQERVVDHVPEFQLQERTSSESITLSHLLTHSTGLPYHCYTNLIEAGLDLKTISGQFEEVALIDRPGGTYAYQNAAFALSGLLMERLAGSSLSGLLEQRVFQPLRMRSASSSYRELTESGNYARPHFRSNADWQSRPPHDSYYNAVLAGGINASITDMTHYLQLLLGHRPEVLSRKMLDQVFFPAIDTRVRGRYYQRWPGHQRSFYGMGWRVQVFEDTTGQMPDTLLHHGGYVDGFRGEMALDRQADLGICVLYNCPNSRAGTVIPETLGRVRPALDSIRAWAKRSRIDRQVSEESAAGTSFWPAMFNQE